MTPGAVDGAEAGEMTDEGYRPLDLDTNRGTVAVRWYEAPASGLAIVCVGGVGGGFDTPAYGLYPRLCLEMLESCASAARVRFRHPIDLDDSVFDVLAAERFLVGHGAESLGFVGHSFGAAVVLQAAARSQEARVVVTLSAQSYGADAVSDLPAGCATMLVHGAEDDVIPPSSSEFVFRRAREPKSLHVLPGNGHGLDESAQETHTLTTEWLRRWLVDRTG